MQLPTSKAAKRMGAFVGVAFALSLAVGAAVSPASAATVDELQAQIAALLSQISTLQSQLNQTGGTTSTGGTGYTFTRDLTIGSTGDDVMQLQKFLNQNGAQVASSGAGAPGNESTYFGSKTAAALAKYQAMKRITPSVGYFGPKTRASVNAMSGTTGGTTTGGTTTSGTGLMVSTASQPISALAPASASRVPFTKVTLTASSDGDVVVNGITVERTGPAQDAVFSGVVLLDENGLQIGISKTLNSNHQVTVGEPFTLKAGQSKTVTVAGNMASSLTSYAGQVVSLSVVGVNTSASVNGALPISGAAHTINATLTMGSATFNVSSFDPNSAQTKEIGTTGQRFAGIRITAGSAEAIRLWSVRWNQTGSASANDLANLKVYVDGTAYDTTVSSDGKYFTALFGSGLVIDKGLSKDVYLQGDIVGTGAAGRTVQFDLYRNTDIYLSGEIYHYGIIGSAGSTGSASTASEFTTGTPFFSGSTFTVSAGSVTAIQKANSVPAQNVAVNVPNQVLGGFEADIKGEPISVQQMIFSVATSSTGVGLLTSVSIYDQNGAVVAGPVDASGAGTTLTFTDTVTFPIGKRTYTLKGKLPSTMSNNGTITLSSTPSSQWTNITGQTTGNTISFSGVGLFTMNAVTVKSGALSISLLSSPATSTVVSGKQNHLFANYVFDATQSGEDVRFSTLPLKLTYTGGSAALLSSCGLYDGTTLLNTGSNIVNPSAGTASGADTTFTLDSPLQVAKGTTKTLALKCNISSSATSSSTYGWGIQSAPTISVTGVTSSNDVAESVAANTGQTMTIGTSGSLGITGINTGTYRVVAANTTGNEVAKFNFHATNEAINLEKLGLTLTSGSSGDFANGTVTIWDGSTQIGTANFGSGSTATSTFSSSVQVPKDSDKILTVKADFAQIGTGQSGTAGRSIKVDYNSAQGKGADSGSTIEGTGSTTFTGVRLQKTYPTLTYPTTAGAASNGTLDLLTLTVAANSTGDVVLNKLTFGVASTTLTLDSYNLIGPNGNVASSTPLIVTSSTTVVAYFDSSSNTDDKVIPAGTSKTYTLRANNVTLTGSNTTGSITTSLKGDTAYPTLSGSYLMASSTVSGLVAQKILWSPVSTSSAYTVTAAYDDWTNGYGLPGCFLAVGQDCAGRTLTK